MTSVESGKPLPAEAGPKLTESPIAQDHPELFHYTGIAGLEGIVRTQTLWATHAAFLNDALEIRAFAARLPSLLRASVEDGMSALIRAHPANQSIVDEVGGLPKAAEQAATAVTEGMYRALLGGPDTPPFAEPWLVSAGKDDTLEPVYDHLVMCACRYKHWGFHEEKEVRVIAIPPNCTISRNGPARFRVNGPTLHGLPAEPRFESFTRPFSLRQVFWL